MSGTSLPPQPSSMSVDLQGDSSLQVEISDAVSERDKVKFTVQTKVRLRGSRGGGGVGFTWLLQEPPSCSLCSPGAQMPAQPLGPAPPPGSWPLTL